MSTQATLDRTDRSTSAAGATPHVDDAVWQALHGDRPPLRVAGVSVTCTDYLEVVDPWDGSIVARAPRASAAHIEQALVAACAYAAAPLEEGRRAELLERWAQGMLEHEQALSERLVRENGKPIVNAMTEVRRAAATARSYARAARELNAKAHAALQAMQRDGKHTPINDEGFACASVYRPLGVVTAFTPFNFPANTVVHKIGAAIAAGNSVLLKPSEKTPLVALALGALLDRAGAPPGSVSVLSGHYAAFGAFLDDPRVAFFSMTGHSIVGARLARRFRSAHPFAGSHFELGGNAPNIVLDDVEPAAAAALLATAVFDQNGSRCTTPRKILVPVGDWGDAFVAAAARCTAQWPTGAPMSVATRLGPLIDEAAAQQVIARVDAAITQGARLIVGGQRRGAVVAATVLDRVTPSMRIVAEENFGPVMCVLRYENLQEAIAIANAGEYGLQPAVTTHDVVTGLRIAAQLRGGTLNVGWATTAHRSDLAPFGGVGASGSGKEGGLVGVRELCVDVPVKYYPASG